MNALEFLRTWGALALGVIGTVLGVRSELRSRKEHRRKEEEWRREDAERAEAGARLKWCQDTARRLEGGSSLIMVDEDKMEWARWGDGEYFVLKTEPGKPFLTRLRRR